MNYQYKMTVKVTKGQFRHGKKFTKHCHFKVMIIYIYIRRNSLIGNLHSKG